MQFEKTHWADEEQVCFRQERFLEQTTSYETMVTQSYICHFTKNTQNNSQTADRMVGTEESIRNKY